ncbi:YjjG family noncanonical pyrimidine nucleotidase [Ureibacillus manganicus]|uniref:HAD family hydrolase n=1 Tax=Ureibacillus manganicus DSM 26584 TaxID=1384049 RepID=A0A0A3I3W2_9BACL|nr:YjjG family noncanonical pyrimidine nucleotidase [Ureibacillus manganicus]KGR78200.1 HAD family hydrolase [Ureibacillus manganicus DSM 26584]
MKQYQTLLFDLDDTLLDFGQAENEALSKLFMELQIPLTDDMKETYKMFNTGLWRAHEEGKIGREELLNTRFAIFFEHYGKKVDGVEFERKYRSYLDEGHQLIDGAMELILDLYEKYDLFIVTNGVVSTQEKRLKDSGLAPYFQHVFVSEEIGFQKPKFEFFDYVFGQLKKCERGTTLIIGDSLTSDIQGGFNADIDTCWFNPHYKKKNIDVEPTYEIRQLTELKDILKITE